MPEEVVSTIPAEMDVHQAAEAMAKAGLFADPVEEPKKKAPPKDPATGKFVKAAEAGAEPPEPAQAEEGEPEKPAAEDADEEAEGEDKPPVPTLKVKLDGMEQDVPVEEVTKGYLRQADYTRKTQELADVRRRFEAEEVPAVRQERQYYAENLERLAEAIEALTPSKEPDWAEHAKTMTPEEFTDHYQQWKANQGRIEKVRAEHARVLALHEQEDKSALATRLQQEREKLEAAIPELKDPEKGKVLREDLSAYAKSIGFTDDDLAGIEDHRALVILNESRLWRESQKRRPTVEAKVERAVQGLKPSGSTPKPRAKEAAMAKERFLSDPSVENAAEAMRAAKIFG